MKHVSVSVCMCVYTVSRCRLYIFYDIRKPCSRLEWELLPSPVVPGVEEPVSQQGGGIWVLTLLEDWSSARANPYLEARMAQMTL